MKRVAVVLAILSSLLVFSVVGEACTLFAAAGDRVAGGGTIIVKNRDWKPDHHQVLKLVTPVNGYRYYGIFAIGNDYMLKQIKLDGYLSIMAMDGH